MDAQADEALEAARRLPHGAARTEAMRKARQLSGNCAANAHSINKGNDVMKEWIAVLRAADTAARWHVHQRRKGIAQEPYINHLLEVSSLVS